MVFLKNRFARERWYERVTNVPASQKPAVLMLAAVRYAESPQVVIDYSDPIGDGITLRLGSSDRGRLDEFAEDLLAVGVEVTDSAPIRQGDPRTDQLRQPQRLARSLDALEAAEAGPKTGPSLAVIIEAMGHATTNVNPPTEASRRTHQALADAYRRLTDGGDPPFTQTRS